VAEPEYRNVTYDPPFGTVEEMQWQVALGGTILFISLVFFLVVIVASWRGGVKSEAIDDSIPAPLSGAEHTPKILDNMKLWVGIAIVLVLLAYTLPLADMVMDGLFSPGAPPSPV
jgi:cytochrome c oxidase subunit 1